MPPGSHALGRARAAVAVVVCGGLAALVLGCAGASFDPSGPCTSDGRRAGAYPDLEALVPHEFREATATAVDSGRNCTAASLGSLASHGVRELRFAGATWATGPNGGVTIAVFDAPGLEAEWVAEFYEQGARAGRDTESVESRQISIPDGRAYRVDALNGESYQTVVDWQDGERVRVVLVASFIREVQSKADHEAVVDEAMAAAEVPSD
ncbi:MAG: hypothetical protein ACJ77F_08315 [Chloroflexota bacterium]